jgi:hypothetical protein
MMVKRWMSFVFVALSMCLGSFAAQAVEPVLYAQAVALDQSYAVQSAVHGLTMAQWRTSNESLNTPIASNLIAMSNHFGMAEAAPFSVPDWDLAG